ncbi:Hypothetical protein A7982_01081 [Minicystis rosea]|nr:Hypothetical protein A7982_01081 [Minicystis rosea]
MGSLPSPARRFAAAAAVVFAIPVLVAGCERKAEEPLPEARPRDPSSVRAAEPAPTAVPGKPWGNRCVKETPATARRQKPPSPDARCPRDPEKPPVLRTGKVTFTDAQDKTISVEIAENDHDRQRGLMYRKSMPEDQGMIFWFDEKGNHSFWMHNTCIPLDMLYIDGDGLIVGIEENTPTMSDDTFEVGCESQYVLEVNAGWTRAHGVRAGQKVKIDGI